MEYKLFIEKVREHLEEYKVNILGIAEKGIYAGREYGHILPDKYEKLNLGLRESEYVLEKSILKLKKCEPFKLHKDWRHMNSSQILCISYFYDFVLDKVKLQKLISNVLNINAKVAEAEFEYVVKEDLSNIDFVVKLKNGGMIYFEIKYTEAEFGIASSEKTDYLSRKENLYSAVDISYEDYLKNYQLVRNICLSSKNTNKYTIFLLPRENSSINKKYDEGVNKIKNIDQFNVQRLYWEDLLVEIPNKTVYEKYFDL